jgi:hypothetical protein
LRRFSSHWNSVCVACVLRGVGGDV